MVSDGVADFEGWYREVHRRVATSLTLVFGDVGLAQDAADEAIARAFERWDRVAVMETPSGWVYRVAFNEARRRVRRRALERRLSSSRVEVVEPPSGELWEVVAGLPARQRQAVVLRHVGQLREVEVAEVMGISPGAVSSTLRAAFASLRAALADPDLLEAR